MPANINKKQIQHSFTLKHFFTSMGSVTRGPENNSRLEILPLYLSSLFLSTSQPHNFKMIKRAMKHILHISSNNTIDAEDRYRAVASYDFTFFSNLPNEILLLIFSFLDVKTLGRAGRVCMEFNEISEFPDLWYASE